MSQQCPPTTAQTVVFPYQMALISYNTDSYSPEQTDNQISSEEINQFFLKLQAVFSTRESLRDLMNMMMRSVCYGLFFVGLPLIGSLKAVLFLDKYIDMTFTENLFYGLILIEYLLLCLSWYWRSQWNFGPFMVNPLFERCQEVVDEENEALRSRGFKWNLPEQFLQGIELTKDLKKGANEFQLETEEKIAFNLIKGRYCKDFYAPEMTEGRVSHEEMYKMISKINPIIRKPLAKPIYRWWAFFLSCDVWVLTLIEINKYFPSLLSYFQISLIAVVFFILTIVIVNRIDAIDQEQFRKKFRARFQGPIGEFNEALRSRGLRWHLPNQFPFSIELWKDYQNQIVGLSPASQKPQENKTEKNYHKEFKDNMYVPLLDNENDKKYE